ncbi:MAG TPA: glycine cleavage T C-terminal barrel domain-containing protein [Vicinamibacterales bacterium]|nr:glycine cleavage T C-terminal barrel domain-containing protein [Vicinamibacterales bacterium]
MQTAYTAAHEQAAWLDRSRRGRIVVSGADRRSYLQGLLTNDIAALTAGTGCYAAYLTAQGRMIADVWVYELGDVILLAMHGDVNDTVLARLDQFIFGEDVQLGDVTATFAAIAVVGPQSAAVVSRALGGVAADALSALPEHGNVRASFADAPAIVTQITDVGEPGFEIYIGAEQRDALVRAIGAAGAAALDAEAAETIRIEAGVPLFHRDMDEETIPLEAGLESRAINFTKGCYVGQEVIIRVLHRGHGRVARRLVRLDVEGADVPQPSAAIEAGDKIVGKVTSAVFSPRLGHPIALAYVQRDVAEPDTIVRISSSSAGGNLSAPISARVTQRIS